MNTTTAAQSKHGGTESGTPAIQLDGTEVALRLRLVGALGLDVTVPFPSLPVVRLTVGRDEGGLYIEVIAAGAPAELQTAPPIATPTGRLDS